MRDPLEKDLDAALSGRRVVVLGVGNRLRGDDALGPEVAARLAGRLACPVFDCGSAPENFTGKVRQSAPEVVLAVDAAEMGAAPGEVRLLSGSRAGAAGLSTHATGLDLLFRYLAAECGAAGWLLAVQPAALEMGEGMSSQVAAAAGRVAGLLERVLAPDA